MECSQRRRFASPFCTFPARTSQAHKDKSPLANANTSRLSTSDSLWNDERDLEKDIGKDSDKNIIERKGRQKICRSLLTKFTELPKEQPLSEMRTSNDICKREGRVSGRSFLDDGVNVKEKEKCASIIEIPVPEMLHGNNVADHSTNCQAILGELIAGSSAHEVEVCHPFDLSALLREESIRQFQTAISPTKIDASALKITNLQHTNIYNLIEDKDHLQRSPFRTTRGINWIKEEAIDLEEHSHLYSAPTGPNSQDMSIGKKRVYAPTEPNSNEEMSVTGKKRVYAPTEPNSNEEMSVTGKKRVYAPTEPNSNEEMSVTGKKRIISYKPLNDEEGSDSRQHPGSTLESHDSYEEMCGKKRMIRGYSVPRCGRTSNQSYQEQVKEFQAILSSKVRQIAEVTDCLQHKELLYRILRL